MKLSMWILADWLKEYNPKTDIKSNEFAIETIRLFSTNITLNNNTMYIGKLCDFFKNGDNNVICIHNNDMIILETTDLEEILNSVLNALDFYNTWNNTMLELLSSNGMLQDLFHASMEVLNEPFFLLDASQRCLAYNTNFKIGQVDSLWDDMLLTGSANVDFLIHFNQQHSKNFSNRNLYFYDNQIFPHNCYNQNFFFQKDWVGVATLVDLTGNISQGRLDVFSILGTYLDRWFQLHIQEEQSILLDHLLQTAITDANTSTVELQRQLILLGWNETDSLMFIKLDAPFQPFSINMYLCRTLNHTFQSVYAVSTELSICVLCNTSLCDFKLLKKDLIPWLERSKYYGVTSMAFTMQDSFFQNYKYTELTSNFCEKLPGKIYSGSQYSLPYIFYQLQQAILPDFLHPAIKTLQLYDEENHTELCLTLYSYLKNERSLIQTAAHLKLHRNSLSYRLHRIQELLDIDLDDYNTRFHILISFEMLSF